MMKFLRHLLFDDFLLKLFSFVLALLFWLTVSFAIQQKEGPASVPTLSLTPDVRMVFRVPVQPLLSPADARKPKFSPVEVDITLQGDAGLMQNLQTRDVRALVDLTTADALRNPSNHVQVTVPVGVTFLRVSPAEVQVNLASRN
jgi:YbbR domain-containing protein